MSFIQTATLNWNSTGKESFVVDSPSYGGLSHYRRLAVTPVSTGSDCGRRLPLSLPVRIPAAKVSAVLSLEGVPTKGCRGEEGPRKGEKAPSLWRLPVVGVLANPC